MGVRLCLESLLMLPREDRCMCTIVTGLSLIPRFPQYFDTEALMLGIVAGKVAVGLETDVIVPTSEQEFLEVTHCL